MGGPGRVQRGRAARHARGDRAPPAPVTGYRVRGSGRGGSETGRSCTRASRTAWTARATAGTWDETLPCGAALGTRPLADLATRRCRWPPPSAAAPQAPGAHGAGAAHPVAAASVPPPRHRPPCPSSALEWSGCPALPTHPPRRGYAQTACAECERSSLSAPCRSPARRVCGSANSRTYRTAFSVTRTRRLQGWGVNGFSRRVRARAVSIRVGGWGEDVPEAG